MELTPFKFIYSTKLGVTLAASDGLIFVQAFIPAEVIDAYFKLDFAKILERQALVISNLEIFSKIAAAKYMRGECTFRKLPGLTFAQIRFCLFDIIISKDWFSSELARNEQPFYRDD
jgi:hypothetical protein